MYSTVCETFLLRQNAHTRGELEKVTHYPMQT